MAKRSQRRLARQKKDKSGCMWGIISMFDFRHDRPSRRLLSDSRRYTNNNTHGPPYPTSEAKLPINSQEMHPNIKDGEKVKKLTCDRMRTRVKEVTKEKMFTDQDPMSIRKHHEHIPTSKTLKKAFDEETLISNQAQKTSQYHDLVALVREILLIYRKRNEQNGDLGMGAKQSFPVAEEKLIAAVEALLNEKSRNGDYKKCHHLKEMFQMLSSNKEMFLKIVQDQNLILLKEDQKSKSKSKGQGPDESHETLTPKHQKISRRRSKSQESISISSCEMDRIVILKPGCSENQAPMGNDVPSDENGYRFQSLKVKRRLRHTMGNEQQTPGPVERSGKMVESGWSSPNRDHFYIERFAKITDRLKTGDNRFSRSRENAESRISDIYAEAKKHLSEMLTSGDEDAESLKRSLPESLGRILSRSPGTSPRGQPKVNKSQLIMTVENPEGKIAVVDDVIYEGNQETVRSPSHDKEHEKKLERFESCDSLAEDRHPESSKQDLPVKNELSSPQSLNEITPEKPSPISVLEPLFSDDDVTPSKTISLLEAAIQPRCIQFDESVSKNQQIRITDSEDNEESAFEYVEALLLSSDLNWSEFETRWLSSVQILDPSLFDEVGTFSSRPTYDQKLLFDSTNEALADVCKCFILESSFIKRNVWRVPKGMDLINEVWSRVESCLCKPCPRDLHDLMRDGLETNRMWLDLQNESNEVVIELEGLIFEETIDEILLSLYLR